MLPEVVLKVGLGRLCSRYSMHGTTYNCFEQEKFVTVVVSLNINVIASVSLLISTGLQIMVNPKNDPCRKVLTFERYQ